MKFFAFLLCLVVFAMPHAFRGVFAFCPSNGNTHVVYVTSNAGDNIWAFDTAGHHIGYVLNKESFPVRVEKLRDMKFGPGGHLYITSARGQFSRIFAVSGNGLLNGTLNRNCTRDYLFTAVKQSDDNPLLDHPYTIAFNPDDDSLYVSNQNTATVTRYKRVDDGTGRFPRWEPAANVVHALANTSAASGSPKRMGLFASSWSGEYTMLSVRGLAISPPLPRALVEQSAPAGSFATQNGLLARYLVVCDVALNKVLVFDADTGAFVFALSVPSPVQVSFPSQYYKPIEPTASYFDVPHVYVTSKEDGMVYLVPFVGAPQSPMAMHEFDVPHQYHTRIYPVTSPTFMHAASGIYENPSHDLLLIADRTGRSIMTYVSPFKSNFEEDDKPSPFLGYFVRGLPDMPEFVFTTSVEQQSAIPFCYELAEDGTFRYVALCSAAYIWITIAIGFGVVAITVYFIRLLRRCVEHSRTCYKSYRGRGGVHESEDVQLLSVAASGGYGTNS
uniref:Mucin-associated surface protein (MASP) n=1 Tax=Trypanosoma congolense (strain IL3000) TaxID=1068625 RepID=G0UWJ3_TRYCI|nr:conserved hypothetical protein [Trypanosoma congolense IL3000]